MIRRCCSPIRAWCHSRTPSSGSSSDHTVVPSPHRNACASRESTTIWKKWGHRRAITPSSRCWATSHSATTSRPTRSRWRGRCSPMSSGCPSNGYGSPSFRGTSASALTKTPPRTGSRQVPIRSGCCDSARRTTSGSWPIPDHVGHAARSRCTSVTTCRRCTPAASTPTIPTTSRSGTTCSCSSSAARCSHCHDRRSTPAWVSSAWPWSCRACARHTRPTCSCRSSSARSRCSAATRPTTRRIVPPTAPSPTTAGRSRFSSPTACCPATRGARTCCGASCAARSIRGAASVSSSRSSPMSSRR